MHFILVPFLLAARIVTNDDATTWNNGPEYTFNARVGMISSLKVDNGRFLGTSLLTKLRCQPKEPDSLVCRYEDTKFTKLSPRGFNPRYTVPDENATYVPFGFGNQSFEIVFNDEGIESYGYERDDGSKTGLLNMYRLIANLLNVGGNIRENKSFVALETSTMGECTVAYNVDRRQINEPVTYDKYELNSLADLEIEHGEMIEITKSRYLNKCLSEPVYSLGTRHTYGIIPFESSEKLKSSDSRILISRTNFTSETVNVLDVYENREKIGSVLDHFHLTLESIEPAKRSLKPIQNRKPTDRDY